MKINKIRTNKLRNHENNERKQEKIENDNLAFAIWVSLDPKFESESETK